MRDELIRYTGVGALVRGDCRAVDVVFQGVAGPHGVAAGSAARSVVPPVNPVKVCLSERAVKDHRLLQQLQRPVVRQQQVSDRRCTHVDVSNEIAVAQTGAVVCGAMADAEVRLGDNEVAPVPTGLRLDLAGVDEVRSVRAVVRDRNMRPLVQRDLFAATVDRQSRQQSQPKPTLLHSRSLCPTRSSTARKHCAGLPSHSLGPFRTTIPCS